MENDAAFCPVCGTKVQATGPNPTGETGQSASGLSNSNMVSSDNNAISKMSKSQKIIILVCILVAVVMIVVLIASLFGGNSKKGAVRDYYQAIEKCDAGKMLNTVPKDYLDELMDRLDCNKKELEESVQEYMDDYLDEYDDIQIDFEDSEMLDKDDLEHEIGINLEDADMTVKKAVTYELKVRYESDGGDNVSTEDEDLTVIKYEGSWYCLEAMIFVTFAAY